MKKDTNQMEYLFIEWAYPTSAHAKKLGKYNDGCYCVESWKEGKLLTLLIKKPFNTAQDAILAAKETGLPFHPITLKFYASLI